MLSFLEAFQNVNSSNLQIRIQLHLYFVLSSQVVKEHCSLTHKDVFKGYS